MGRGALVVFEGAEGVGKTTQIARLADAVRASGRTVQVYREPGGTPAGEAVRAMLLDPGMTLAASAEALLFLASRAQLVADRVRPALDRGDLVILDRFFLSTYAYQVAGRGLDGEHVRAANQLAVAGLVPHLTLVLDLPEDEGMRRASGRGAPDRMELASDDFHRRVAEAFRAFTTVEWQRSHPECGPIVRVDAGGDPDDVAARVANATESLLNGVSSG